MIRSDVLTNLRMAGQVRRYHTWPMHTVQTVADHSWNVMRIYNQIFGALPSLVTQYILYHDCGEVVLGDLPYPVKKNNSELDVQCKLVERLALHELGVELPVLTDEHKLQVKLCDLIDMLELGLVERAMGNKFATPIVDDVWSNICLLVEQLPTQLDVKVVKYVQAAMNRW